jgi:hypothetical protein
VIANHRRVDYQFCLSSRIWLRHSLASAFDVSFPSLSSPRQRAGLLNQGRHGGTALVSPSGAADLQRAGVRTGLDGVSYAMDVSAAHGLPTISHDGSGFDSHANVVLIPDREWGVVVMEKGENSPDEFFGSRRMTGIANGVAGMLIGEEPPASSSSRSLWVVYGVVLGTSSSRSSEWSEACGTSVRGALSHRLPAIGRRRTRLRLEPGQIHLPQQHPRAVGRG